MRCELNRLDFAGELTEAPEPSTAMLLSAGILGLAVAASRNDGHRVKGMRDARSRRSIVEGVTPRMQ
jgi:PEP-CTERM motif